MHPPPVVWIASKFELAGPFACMLEHGARSSDTRKWLVMSPDGGGRVETGAEIGRRVSRPDPFSPVNVCHSATLFDIPPLLGGARRIETLDEPSPTTEPGGPAFFNHNQR